DVSTARQHKRRALVGYDQHRFEMAQVLIGSPLFAELDCRALELSVELLELGLETGEEREGVRSRAGESGDDLVVVEAPHLARAGFHARLVKRDLPIAGDRHAAVSSHREDCCAAYPGAL